MERREGEKRKRAKRKGGGWIWWTGQKKFAKEKRRNGCQRIGGKKRTRQVSNKSPYSILQYGPSKKSDLACT